MPIINGEQSFTEKPISTSFQNPDEIIVAQKENYNFEGELAKTAPESVGNKKPIVKRTFLRRGKKRYYILNNYSTYRVYTGFNYGKRGQKKLPRIIFIIIINLIN